MKKITSLFCILISLQLPLAFAEESPKCPVPAESLDPLDSKNSKSFEVLEVQVRNSACDNETIFNKVSDPKFIVNHNRLHCNEIELCLGKSNDAEANQAATELMKENLPKAVLLGVLDQEIQKKLKYNVLLKRFEESHHQKVCPSEKVETNCEKDIRRAFASVSGTFIGYPGLDLGPTSSETTENYFAKKFLKSNDFKKISKSKEELSRGCAEKISFTNICNLRDARLKTISDCENNPQSKGCLDNEQKALASLLDSQKNNRPVFLAMEKQLCTSTRLVQDSPTQSTLLVSMPGIGPIGTFGRIQGFNQHLGLRTDAKPPGLRLDANSLLVPGASMGARVPASDKPVETAEDDNKGGQKPDASGVIGTGVLKVDIARAPASNESAREEIKAFSANDTSTLSDTFSKSLSESIGNTNKAVANNIPNTTANNNWNADLSTRFNALNEEENKKKLADKLAEETTVVNPSDKKKKEDEVSALTAQINGLKTKLEEMNQNVEDLKSKKEAVGEDKDKIDKDSLEREKSILDLKKKLAELEADKKKVQADSIAKSQEDDKARTRAEARASSNANAAVFANHSVDSEQSDIGKRERDKAANSSNQASVSFSESRAPASVGTPQSASAVSAIVLHSVGSQATPDSAVVYMTDVEMQKYPFRLNDNATPKDIEKMILGNNGASIILGNSEQIIPIVINGVVQLDEKGHVKYKKIKISLVKNERERKQSIAREISSIADLKREDQKKRELIRYQEMKNVIKDATK
jgi:hypothetical protein